MPSDCTALSPDTVSTTTVAMTGLNLSVSEKFAKFVLSFSLLSECSDGIVVQNKLGGEGGAWEMVVMGDIAAKRKGLRSRWPWPALVPCPAFRGCSVVCRGPVPWCSVVCAVVCRGCSGGVPWGSKQNTHPWGLG